MTNGKYDPEALPEPTQAELEERSRRHLRDAGEYPDENNRLSTRERRTNERNVCSHRMESGAWCILPDGHLGVHRGLPPRAGCLPPPPDRKLMSSYRLELSEKYDDKKRPQPWRDRFGVMAPANTSPAQWWVMRCEGRGR